MRIRDQKKYNAIVQTSIQLINELGFSGISIAKIAHEAKTSPATIYIYFENKEDLLTKIYLNIRKKISQAALQGLDDAKSIKEQFKLIWHNFFTYALAHNDFLIYREYFERTSMMKKIRQENFELFKYITNLLQRGIKEKSIKELPLPFLTAFAFMPIISLLKVNFEAGIKMDDNLINQASEIAWKSIKI
ncbi:TetR/AcrR family transcriptional regulator [Promethearchaeum syntrophicum]|uniref:TetR/AcrR family transcriptional regulator n=1 Tax=Promethearchaeum syntrophicum TaxID=2594042 RepID=A0A5B9DA90_9ARCH|nr:TetR/AcrR family transcriptional regulator [Candidatus Prometheoarchaeum syntrophicum]QEE15767.1 transcriptional regulator BetI [Candidatus Prometheoarchaeum syntrophicum]